jgi:hypothetical protein
MLKLRARGLMAGVAGLVALGACAAGVSAMAQGPDVGWEYNGGLAQDHYSALAQITKANVSQLKPVWTFQVEPGAQQAQPIVVGRTLYAQRLLPDLTGGGLPQPDRRGRRSGGRDLPGLAKPGAGL